MVGVLDSELVSGCMTMEIVFVGGRRGLVPSGRVLGLGLGMAMDMGLEEM